MIPSVILEGRLMLSNEHNYLDTMFRNDIAEAMPGRNDENATGDDAGLCSGVQALLTLA